MKLLYEGKRYSIYIDAVKSAYNFHASYEIIILEKDSTNLSLAKTFKREEIIRSASESIFNFLQSIEGIGNDQLNMIYEKSISFMNEEINITDDREPNILHIYQIVGNHIIEKSSIEKDKYHFNQKENTVSVDSNSFDEILKFHEIKISKNKFFSELRKLEFIINEQLIISNNGRRGYTLNTTGNRRVYRIKYYKDINDKIKNAFQSEGGKK